MTGQPLTVLCRYQYDPIDRLASCTPLSQQSIQRFYRNDRLGTEIQGAKQYSFFEHGTQVLAQQMREAGKVECALQATDFQGSVLHAVAGGQHQQMVYSAYGHRSPESGLISLLGFNGERRDSVTGYYFLGRRPFSPALMQFFCADRLSPFGRGGINARAYCLGDPVNNVDPRGEFAMLARGINQLVSSPVAALRQVWKGGKSLKKAVVNSVRKTPGPYSATEDAMKGLAKTDPKKYAAIVNESAARANELNMYEAGGAYRHAEKVLQSQNLAYSKLQTLAKSQGFRNEDILKQPILKGYPQALPNLQQADRQLANVTLDHVLKHPEELIAINKLTDLIRRT